jgi:circadian clock protein KaiB
MSKDDTQDVREAEEHYVLRLYVTGMTPRSLHAIENVKRIAEEHFPGRYELEIIDIYQHPEAAKEAQLLAAPTMIKLLPLPLRRFVGDMSDKDKILVGLDLQPKRGEG